MKSTFCKNFTESCQREKKEVQKQKKGYRGHTKFNYLVMFNLYFKLDKHFSKAKKQIMSLIVIDKWRIPTSGSHEKNLLEPKQLSNCPDFIRENCIQIYKVVHTCDKAV